MNTDEEKGPRDSMQVRQYRAEDRAEWLRLLGGLWYDLTAEEVAAVAEADLNERQMTVFVVERPVGGLAGFVELRLRDWAEGCLAEPVPYVEAWYVDPDVRRQGLGRRLFEAAEAWAVAGGFAEIASDCAPDNAPSLAAHRAMGYQEVMRVVHFQKTLGTSEARRVD